MQSLVAGTETVEFANAPNGVIQFVGNGSGATFTFQGPSSGSFGITAESNFTSAGTLLNLMGDITGSFSYSTTGPDFVNVPGVLEQANVTTNGPAEFMIHDGSGFDFTASLLWDTITSIASGGGVSTSATVNLTNFAYQGSNEQLRELRDTTGGNVTAHFNIGSPELDLIALAANNTNSGSFGGTLVAATPEPTQVGLLVIGLLGIAGTIRRYLQA